MQFPHPTDYQRHVEDMPPAWPRTGGVNGATTAMLATGGGEPKPKPDPDQQPGEPAPETPRPDDGRQDPAPLPQTGE